VSGLDGSPTVVSPPAAHDVGALDRRVLRTAAALVLVPCALFAAAVLLLLVVRGQGIGIGYELWPRMLVLALGLLVAAGVVAALIVVLTDRMAGALDRRVLQTAATLVLVPCLLFGAAIILLLIERGQGFAMGYDSRLKTLVVALGLLVAAGVVAALVVVLRDRPAKAPSDAESRLAASPAGRSRATSVGTRAFVVMLIVVLIPSFCLASFGVWAYFKSWDRAQALYEEQASYRAFTLQNEIVGLAKSPARFTAAQRALLSTAIVYQNSSYDQQNGAVATTLDQIRTDKSLAPVIVHALQHQGYALAMDRTLVSSPTRVDIVAWVGPGGGVLVYAPGWNGSSVSIAPYAPVGRLLWIGLAGLALTAVLGLLGSCILSRTVVWPVRRLAAASGRLADGEAGVTVTPSGPRELRDLAVAFNDMNAKTTKAQEAEQSFLLSVSHELKTPLTSIRGYAEGLADGALPAAEGAAVIGAESARLERLVGDLLDSARMRKSAFTVRGETVDLAAVAQEVSRRYEATARDDGLSLLLKLAPESLATADHGRVLQVVSNLVENAVRCTPSPGSVTITTAPGLVSVSDTGQGLTNDDLPRAFERFYLYSRYGHHRPVGTGLGLAIVKELTEAMGGRVRVSSAVGVGTAFSVELPIAEGRPPGEAQTEAPSAAEAATAAEVTPVSDDLVTAVEPAAPAEAAADPAELAAPVSETAEPTTVVVDPADDGE
jgi:signal transduction histidine kinase